MNNKRKRPPPQRVVHVLEARGITSVRISGSDPHRPRVGQMEHRGYSTR